MTTPMYGEGIPFERKNLVSQLVGQELKSLVRYSWLPEDEVINEYGIGRNEVFSLTSGPLLMYFASGLAVGFSSDPSKNSIVLWVEKNENGESIDEPTEDDEELFSIDAKEQSLFWNDFLNKKISATHVVHRKPSSAKMAELANEVGLIIAFEDGSELILSHGLHDNSDDFSVISREQISNDVISQLDM
ncbi:MAG: hypothetical protein P8179_22510 [Candidatus Thiodiazotropha sp.]|jgi:hypothetical protein